LVAAADILYHPQEHDRGVLHGTGDAAMAHDEQKEPLAGRLGGQGQVVSGAFGDLNEHRARELILETARELRYPATKADVAAEARRQRVPPQLTELIGELPEREYVSPEDVAEEAARID
jgi:hypothetical protein